MLILLVNKVAKCPAPERYCCHLSKNSRRILVDMTKRVYEITYTDEAVLGLELLGRLQVVVDQSEASGLSASESSAETEDEDNLLIDLVHLGELLAELILGDVGAGRVDNIHDL
jgi:hypothetical protein